MSNDNSYTRQELEEAISDFLESCHRTGHHNLQDNINYFLSENDHMDLDEEEVEAIFTELDN